MTDLDGKSPPAGPNDWTGDELRKKGNCENKIAQGPCWLQDAAINIERVRKRMESVKGNADRQQNVEVRRLINDPRARKHPLEILKKKISVLKKAEHAEIHADAGDEPALLCALSLGFANLAAEPEIHRGGGEEQRGKRRIPCAIENVTRDNEEILAGVPTVETPIDRGNDDVENDEGERIKKHGQRPLT